MSLKNPLPKSFHYAADGIREAVKNEPNFRFHLLAAIFVIIAGLKLGLSQPEWFAIGFSIFFVIILELVNTSLEAITDLVSPKFHSRAKVAKDVAAAAVLLASIFALIIGAAIFIPKLSLIFPK